MASSRTAAGSRAATCPGSWKKPWRSASSPYGERLSRMPFRSTFSRMALRTAWVRRSSPRRKFTLTVATGGMPSRSATSAAVSRGFVSRGPSVPRSAGQRVSKEWGVSARNSA